ncbi:MAG: hypothetical protein KGP28_07325 [Bdellovibrionales bacterium]|nr:hypothetical protein [Bdellovibrionales bacterium]
MNSFIYLYSKFTEELLLLGGALIFTLMAIYCYEWVIKKRRLGAARNQIPAAMVKVYLNQLINEAQFVRTQLFGLVNGMPNEGAHLANTSSPNVPTSESHDSPAVQLIQSATATFGGDLEARLKALQNQLTEKESIVVNINIEKTKLLEEIENLRQNQKAMQSAGNGGGNSDELPRKIRELEARLEEYSLFEDDLANLKRLQQENLQLKKKLEDLGSGLPVQAPALTAVSEPGMKPEVIEKQILATASPEPEAETKPDKKALDQSTIDALLEGKPVMPPEHLAQPVVAPTIQPPKDEFENLVSSVETSLEPKEADAVPAANVAAAPAGNAPTAPASELQVAKSDEDLLKEFENLLNS